MVSCSGSDVRQYTDECKAHTPSGQMDRSWTCCVRRKVPFRSDDEFEGGSVAPAAVGTPITWVSAGDAAGQALMVGMPLVPAAAAALSAQLVHGSRKLQLAVLQQGNGSVMLGLPSDFSLAPWGLHSPGRLSHSDTTLYIVYG